MSQQPSGTVTFLFTDVEGSTRLWEADRARMSSLLQQHEALVRGAIQGPGGYVFKTVGDAFCATFQEAIRAVDAAIAIERGQASVGSGGDPLRTRVAIHSGVAEEREGDYFGPAVNRVARLLSLAAGGQILVSASAAELVRDSLPAGASLRDMGEHRLKDLSRPERVYQLEAEGLPTDFPPLHAPELPPNNLTEPPNAFVGRSKDVAALEAMLQRQDVRLVTVTGPGGTGKTRLAHEVGTNLLEHFDDGVFFFSLASIAQAGLVASSIEAVLGIKETGEGSTVDVLAQYLRHREILLILDNFEHLLDARALISELLDACPAVKILVTSRTVLNLSREREFPLGPLSLPQVGHAHNLRELKKSDAIALFVERAQAVKPSFRLDDDNADAVMEICWRLDGLPLAIELAAARTRLFRPRALLARLEEHRLDFLKGGAVDVPERLQTLRGTIDWSYELLSEPEQRLFRRLAVFAGGCTLDAPEAICGEDSGFSGGVLDGIESLLEKSLLRQDDSSHVDPRVRMLETIRDFATERLVASGEEGMLRERHASYFLLLAEDLNRQGFSGGARRAREVEMDNFRAALAWLIDRQEADSAYRLVNALWTFWWVSGYFAEGARWSEAAVALPGGDQRLRAKALDAAGNMSLVRGDLQVAKKRLTEALQVHRSLHDREAIAGSICSLGVVAEQEGRFQEAERCYREHLEIGRELHDEGLQAAATGNLAGALVLLGDDSQAEKLSTESLGRFRRLNSGQGVERQLEILVFLALERGDIDRAIELQTEDLRLCRSLQMRENLANCLETAGKVAVAADKAEPAARIWGAAEALREELGQPLQSHRPGVRERYLDQARKKLGDRPFFEEWNAGRGMTGDQIEAYALQLMERLATEGNGRPHSG